MKHLFLLCLFILTGCSATLSFGLKKDVFADGRPDNSPYEAEAMILFKNDHFLEGRR